ncbi:MAG: hypothetical protein CSA65_01705 [Proteobacteria bacterium]|nr:MAG: hypothetical protein CSA65_01705 [Pseudomonadota bacterium]
MNATRLVHRRRPHLLLAIAALWLVAACAPRTKLNPHAILRVREGMTLIQRGDLDRAEARLTLALEYNPNYAEAYNGLGLVYYHRGQRWRAMKTFRRALLLDGELAEAHNNLGVVLLERGDYRDAAACFQAALAIDPGYANARFNLALGLLQTGKLIAAEKELLKTLASAPQMASAHAELGCLYVHKSRRAAADRALRQALALSPKLAAVHRCRGRLQRQAGDLVGAEASLRRARQLDPSDAEALHELAIVLLLSGKEKAAEQQLKTLIARRPRQPEVHFALAFLLQADPLDATRQVRAERALRRALKLRSDYPAAQLLLGDLLARQGREKAASQAYRRFLKRVPMALVDQRQRVASWLQARNKPPQGERPALSAIRTAPHTPAGR